MKVLASVVAVLGRPARVEIDTRPVENLARLKDPLCLNRAGSWYDRQVLIWVLEQPCPQFGFVRRPMGSFRSTISCAWFSTRSRRWYGSPLPMAQRYTTVSAGWNSPAFHWSKRAAGGGPLPFTKTTSTV